MQNSTSSVFKREEFTSGERVGREKESGHPIRLAEVGRNIVPSKQCRNCGSYLETSPEHAEGDWFIQCLYCDAKNIVVPVLQVIGWRI